MCGINPNTERLNAEMLGMGVKLIGGAIEAMLRAEQLPNPQQSDVLAAATTAYREGKITKSQYIRVIDALDEPDWVKNGTKPPTHPMIARLIEDARQAGFTD